MNRAKHRRDSPYKRTAPVWQCAVALPLAWFVLVSCSSKEKPAEPSGATSTTKTTEADEPKNIVPDDASEGTLSEKEAWLQAHVSKLSDDAMMGRQTLEPGGEMATTYVAKEFETYGLNPLPGHTFKVPYSLYGFGFDPVNTTLEAGGESYKPAAGYTPFSFSTEGDVSGELVFAGYGIHAPKLGWDDYKDLNVRGKIILVLRHYPGEDKESELGKSDFGLFATKAKEARRRGAKAMILVTDPVHHKTDDAKLQVARRLSLRPLAEPSRQTILPAIHLSQELAGTLLEGSKISLSNMQQLLDAGTKPAELARGLGQVRLKTKRRDPKAAQKADNVIGVVEGSDPEAGWIVVGAHLDHIGGTKGPGDTIHNGADDNASGTTGMLYLAKAIASGPQPRHSFVFMGFSGEEDGLLGSKAFIKSELGKGAPIRFMLNLDMIGRNSDKPVTIYGDGSAEELRELVRLAQDPSEPLPVQFFGNEHPSNSDHHPFYERNIPYLFFFTGVHDDYHGLGDHANKLDYPRMARLIALAERTLRSIDGRTAPLPFVHFLRWLGVRASDRGKEGLVVTAIDLESPAVDAGIMPFDRIVAINGKNKGLAKELASLKVGKHTLKLERGGKPAGTVQIQRRTKGYMGVYYESTPDEVIKGAGLKPDSGFMVTQVAKGAAKNAGVQKGDVVVTMNGRSVNTKNLRTMMEQLGAGTKVVLGIVRKDGGGNWAKKELTMVLGARK